MRQERQRSSDEVLAARRIEPEFFEVQAEPLRSSFDAGRRSVERPNEVRCNPQVVSLAEFAADNLRIKLPATLHFDNSYDVRGCWRIGGGRYDQVGATAKIAVVAAELMLSPHVVNAG